MSKKVALPLMLLSLGIFSATCTVGCGSSSPGGGTGGAAAGGHSGSGGMATSSGGAGGGAVGGHGGSGPDAGTGGSGVGGAGAVDGGMDVRPDAIDAAVDAPRDVAMDVPVDVPVDVPADVRVDVPVDVRTDVATDVGTDVTIDTGATDAVDASTMRTYQVSLTPIAGLAVPSTGSGTATVLVNTATGAVSASGTFTGLTSVVTAGHIHDNTTAVVIPFTLSGLNGAQTAGSFAGSATLTPPQILSLTTSNLWYVNIHSTSNGAGEIRGFITP